jgi:hypothetical protein
MRQVLDEAVTGGDARHAPHQIERTADDLDIGAAPQRLGHGDSGGLGASEQGKLMFTAMTRSHPRRRIGAQHQGVTARRAAAFEIDINGPVLLDRAPPQGCHVGEDRPSGSGSGGDETTEPLLRLSVGNQVARHRQSQKSLPSAM